MYAPFAFRPWQITVVSKSSSGSAMDEWVRLPLMQMHKRQRQMHDQSSDSSAISNSSCAYLLRPSMHADCFHFHLTIPFNESIMFVKNRWRTASEGIGCHAFDFESLPNNKILLHFLAFRHVITHPSSTQAVR